jgi:hypothetical protein
VVAALGFTLIVGPGLVTGTAAAGPGLFLSWNDCSLSAASSNSLIVPCVNRAEEQLVASFELATRVDSVIALEAVVDVQSAAPSLPAWWGYAPAGCRFGELTASATFVGHSACADFWHGLATFDGPPVYSPTAPRGGANQARIVMSFAVLSSQLISLEAGTRYYAARLVFQNDSTGTCGGCTVPACLVLNSIRLIRPPGSTGGDVVLGAPGEADSNLALWQSTQASCAAVPAQRLSWGRLKALYR